MRTKQRVTDLLIGLLVTVFFLSVIFTGTFDFTDAIEMKALDLRARIAARDDRNPAIELVTVNRNDLSELGPLPWPRKILAQGIRNISLAGARVIALDMLFARPEENAGLKTLTRLKENYKSLGLARPGAGLAFYKKLSNALVDIDNDTKLYKAIEKSGNVVLPVRFETRNTVRDRRVPDFIAKHAFKRINGLKRKGAVSSLKWMSKLSPVLPGFAGVAAGLGHINFFPDRDGYLRNQIHVLGYLKDTYFPSFSLAIVKLFKGLKDGDMTVVLGEGIELNVVSLPVIKIPAIDYQMRTLINWNRGPGVAFHQTPFTKVLKNQVQTSLFRDKIVIIGTTAAGIGDEFPTPVSGNMPVLEIIANSVANILNQTFIRRPQWAPAAELSLLIFAGLFVTFALSGLKSGTGTIITLMLLLGYGIVGAILYLSSYIWLRVTPPMLLLVAGYLLITFSRIFIKRNAKIKIEVNKNAGSLTDLNKADYKPGHVHAPGVVESPDNVYSGDMEDGLIDFGARTSLGHYKLISEIGRGAIGIVYKGQDRKTHRVVAIKAINLSTFDAEIVNDVRNRFFKVAESARLFSHPNIVTIYDYGEDNDLIYIAMEYLEGQDLDQYTKKGYICPVRETLRMIGSVADALDYAHRKNLVHQDIKPSNIIKISKTGHVKITDFGIVQTPSYMSPEQVSGKMIDGRSDIFSLGVVLFEMVTGEKPFTGEDMTSLMLNITKERHASPKVINQKIPHIVEKIINKALEKDLDKRYQKAGQMAGHLKQVVAKMDELLAGKMSTKNKYPG